MIGIATAGYDIAIAWDHHVGEIMTLRSSGNLWP